MTSNPALAVDDPSRPDETDEVVRGPGGRRAGPAQLALLLVGVCMPVLGTTLIAPVLPQMIRHFASTPGSAVLVPVALTIPSLLLALSAPVAGFLADRLNRKPLLVAAMVAYAIVGTAPLYLTSLHAVVGSRLLLGACEGVVMTCCTTLIGDYWTGRRRARYLSLSTMVSSLSAAVFLALGGLLGASGWRVPFWAYGVGVLVAVPMAVLLWSPARGQAAPGRARLEPLPVREILAPCLVTVFGGLVFFVLVAELPFVLEDIGQKDPAVTGAVISVMSLVTAVGAGLFTWFGRFAARTLVPAQFLGAAAGLALVWLAPGMPGIVVGALITGFSTGMLLPTLLVWAVHRLRYAQRARGTGWWSSALTLGVFVTPLVVAGIAARLGGVRPALGAVAALALAVGLVAVFTLRRLSAPLVPTGAEPEPAPVA